MVQPLKFGKGITFSHTLLGMWLLIHAGIQVNFKLTSASPGLAYGV